MENKLNLAAQLTEKVQKEYDVYIESLYRMVVDEVINNSYKTVMMNELKILIEKYSCELLEEWQIELLLNIENLLETLFYNWIHFDSTEEDIYKEFVFGYWNREYLRENN